MCNTKPVPVSDLLQKFRDSHPELQPHSLPKYFETFSRKREDRAVSRIAAGDLILRRQYGHHEPIWMGIVGEVLGKEAVVLTTKGRKKILLCRDGDVLNWDMRILKAEPASLDESYRSYDWFAEDSKVAAGYVVSSAADVFTSADATSKKKTTLAKETVIQSISEKKLVEGKWWYEIQFLDGSRPASGWTGSDNIMELADHTNFTFLTPGSDSSGSSFEDLRDAVKEHKILTEIARSINYCNIVLLSDHTLPDFIRSVFYHAMVLAKGDFKKAALILTAAVRAFKETGKRGNFPWVQSKLQTKPKFSFNVYRDKIWHFFWNAYEIFTGTGELWLDFKGVMYELKSRPRPILSLLPPWNPDPLDKDSKSDIVFNRGGVMYAKWVQKNKDAVLKYHTEMAINALNDVVDKMDETKDLSYEKKKVFVEKVFKANEKEITTDILKKAYADYADYAGQAFENVLKAVSTIPDDASTKESLPETQEDVFGTWEETTADVVKQINEYNPADAATLVINRIEFNTGISGIKNYRNWKTDASVVHNRKKNAYRDPFGIKLLVLHESAADTGDGYDDTNNTTAHLSVKKDATILQFNDLVELENHSSGLNKVAIGIEFVNRGWLSSKTDDGGEGIPSSEARLTENQKEVYKEANGYLWAFWGYGFNIYRLPASLDQLEKEVELVDWITKTFPQSIQAIKNLSFNIFSWIEKMFPAIDQVWLQWVSYDDVKHVWKFKAKDIPADTAAKNLFIMTTAYEFLQPDQVKNKTGILSHNSFYSGHSDGSFLSLYTWLRLKKGKDKNKAFDLSKKLMKDHHIMASLKTDNDKKIFLLDVNDDHLT